ncbi:hypothetical protein IF2G_02566 [Cordyceps javanica]|nr:hypothetical protein IF2G_02566 [Cordyceps javanica]
MPTVAYNIEKDLKYMIKPGVVGDYKLSEVVPELEVVVSAEFAEVCDDGSETRERGRITNAKKRVLPLISKRPANRITADPRQGVATSEI